MSKRAWVFPGQGSQTVGMLKDLAAHHPLVEETFSRASKVLGYDLWDVVQNDNGQTLGQTQVTQPALLAASFAIFQVLKAQSANLPHYLAGHSLGEYSALVCAGVLSFEDGVKLVEARGQFMQQAVPEGVGAMYAIIGLDDAKVIQACEQAQNETQQIVSAVNFNSPGQVVIAGNAEAAEKSAELCKEAGAKRALPLAVSVPSHCALMKPAADKLAELFETIEFTTPSIGVVNNVDVAIESNVEDIKSALLRQLYSPVRWTETIQKLSALGVSQIHEIGPGKVLTGLIKRIDKSLSCDAVNNAETVSTIQ
ncbi:[Acyl-carrier-protein] S-malonyltransferase [Paraglaciecola sp. T6c]|uniref:ACP S-malonyltransferase n=1 Tax=Pseudoalteromonas atlantica (strain T6c / ATCC BAA-1087) TaxID=3042615 RepID=UPI00005C5166|nr:ACP S-malonyltransferase [Paraglaciecola sp. T6c]ABG40641.1 [Acyl-carrier-protein] S-malonyltransferase [Paraglaciecola sp. T6c]